MFADTRKLKELTQDPQSLAEYLDSLSNAQFRASCNALSDNILPSVSGECFSEIFTTLFQLDSKAYLGLLLKALKAGKHPCDFFSNLEFTDIDRRKIVLSLLPEIIVPKDAELLFRSIGINALGDRIPYLLLVNTKVTGFLLLQALRYVEHDRPLLIRTCHYLMKRGDALSFSVASIIRLSFSLEEVKGTFSLHLEPYQLSRVESNFESFSSTVSI